jgi:hypothetical protein
MHSIEEVTSWGVEEIKAQINALLPEGWRIEYETTPQAFFCQITNTDGLSEAFTQPDQRLLLLDIYGKLLNGRRGPSPAWVHNRPDPRAKLIRQGVYTVQSNGVEEPAVPMDIDPSAIREMIEKHRH